MAELTVFNDNTSMPAHLTQAFGLGSNDDLTAGVSGGYPILSYRGKVWAVSSGGDRQVITGEDGDPKGSLEVVLVKANPHISKIYYPNGYEEGSNEKPTCYSNDGIAPALDAEMSQAAKCAVCPHNQWGSRISETGGKGKACADSRRIAVSPVGDIENPMLLRIPAASLRTLADYAQMLVRRQTPYQAVVTKIGFDPEAAYPKLTFRPLRYLDEAEAKLVFDVMGRDVVSQITTLSSATMALDAQAEAQADDLGPPPAHVTQMAQPAPQPAPQPVQQPAPQPVQQAAPTSVAPVAQPAPPPPPPPVQATSTLMEAASSELDAVLAEFDDVED